jgi:MFS family permease
MYGPTVMAQTGFSANKIGWISALNNTFGILGTWICAMLIDRVGRRKMLYVGSLGCAASMFIAGGFAKLVADNPDNRLGYGIGTTVFLFIFTMFFSSTWLMVTWIYPTEIFPTEVRTKGNSFAVSGFAVGCAWTTLVNPIMFSRITYNTFWIFGILNFIYPVLIWAFYPETAKRSLETMDFLFASKSPFAWEEEKMLEKLITEHGGKLTLQDVLDDSDEKEEKTIEQRAEVAKA